MIYISVYYLPFIITVLLWIIIGTLIELNHKLVANFLCFGTFVVTLITIIFYIFLCVFWLTEQIEITF